MPNSQTTLLSADSLTCIREDRVLFDQLDFELNAGDILQIEGPNGSGKSSLLRILAGLSQPYEGKVLYKQSPIKKAWEDYQADMLYIGHLNGVKAELSAIDNLDFALALDGYQNVDSETALEQVNLAGFEHFEAAKLSAGQHKRTALARLWHSDCHIWILDEPFTAIDKQGVKELEQKMLEHTSNGGAIIITTHQDLMLADQPNYKNITLEYRF
ncbi:cytochrome c biogenesis heme-transporting ATPase CcmA [Paraferrimonas sp. SM1919]|uniref:cytochrome c biogenesis heme-transporting ATPase CcmA n=1 Tax=Paraferrimonas sp. SM1919 TaxID=2662263 RepID=UPI0013D56B5D|nr:cytochrome c biogenesis heme-transporting ATPase CcmA [Paraferrimonas sp. SM1919]